MPSYWRKILRVNLSQGTIAVEEPDESLYRRYFGGAAFIAHYLLSEVPAGADPLGPENKLIFMPGVLTGTPLPGAARDCVGAKSPLSGGLGRSEAGGFFGTELKKAGFDGIIFEGKAEKPVYLWVHDGEAELRDASHLWGKETLAVQKAMREELGDRLVRTALIGQGGENLVRFACVINDVKDAHGRSGMGAVMGSKNLKGVAVRGHMTPQSEDPETIKRLGKWVAETVEQYNLGFHTYGTGDQIQAFEASGNLPINNFKGGFFPRVMDISPQKMKETIRVGMEGCYACPVRCKRPCKVAEGPYQTDPDYGGPEYESIGALGSNCGITNLEALAKAHQLCQMYSLDTISAGVAVSFVMECFEKGILTAADTGGLEVRWGDADAMLRLLEMIAHREGIGDLLAEGATRAAAKIGKGSEEFVMDVKGVGIPMHEPRFKVSLGICYAVNEFGADHCSGLHDPAYVKHTSGHFGLEMLKSVGFTDPLPRDDMGPLKVAMGVTMRQFKGFVDSATMCYFVQFQMLQLAEAVRAATGWNTSVAECLKVGERAITLARIFNLREGLTVDDDVLPKRFYTRFEEGPLKGQGLDYDTFLRARGDFYELMGWDRETSVPTKLKLEQLGIGWAAQALTPAASR
ncbi:MAG: aldehyde ferredoxin oxidoreductase family protein [Chloroflexota bacterium]